MLCAVLPTLALLAEARDRPLARFLLALAPSRNERTSNHPCGNIKFEVYGNPHRIPARRLILGLRRVHVAVLGGGHRSGHRS